MQVSVLGAGVSGLTTAIRLQESGFEVTIFAKSMSPNTVSDVAAAWWYPFLAEPVEKTNKWSSNTFYELNRLREEENIECITMRLGREYLKDECELPGWSSEIPHFRLLEKNEIIKGFSFGWEIEAPVIEMNHYMPWLLSRFKELGGSCELREFTKLQDVPGNVIVNCCGLGGRELCNDNELKPVRGQVIYIKQDPGFGRFDQKPETLTYTIPRRDVTVLGGTAQKDDWEENVRPEENEYILSKCEKLWPELDRGNIVGSAVGLRPSRSEIRLEEEMINGKKILHNYGHGGAGVTLSWGCADEIVKMMKTNTKT